MKVVFCFAVLAIACAYANMCSDSAPCDATVTMCHHGFTLNCIKNHCLCTDTAAVHNCTTKADCTTGCMHHQGGTVAHCVDNRCHCGPR